MNSKSILLASLTTAIWSSCLAVGVSGDLLPYSWQAPSHVKALPPAKLIHVMLTEDPSPPTPSSDQPAAQSNLQPLPPALPDTVAPPPAPALAAVALPSPDIPFAKPVEEPSQIVDAKNAAPTAPLPANAKPAAPSATGVRHITYGQGEGVQPKPDYPREAINAGQQGTVMIRFVVNEEGKVASAEVQSGCRWPLLNQAALLAVRDRWHFSPGPARVYDVSIQYKLTER